MIDKLILFLQKDIIKNFFIYTIGAVFLKGVSFLLIPVYTKVLTPAEFGQLELITTITTVLSILLSYGLPQIVFIEYFHIKKEEKLSYINKIISVYFISATPTFLIVYFILLNLNLITIAENKFLFISFAILSSYLLFFQTIFFSVLQLEKQALKLTKYKVFAGIGMALLNIILVYYFRYGVVGILFTNFIILLISLIFVLPKRNNWANLGSLKNTSIKDDLVPKIKMGFPYILSSLSFWMIAAIDRWIILYYLDQHSVGLYSLAYKFAVVYEPLLISPILSIYSPYIFEKFRNQDLDQKAFTVTLVTVLVFLILAFISYLVASTMINESFQQSLVLIPLLVIGFSFTLLAQIFASLMIFFNKSKLMVKNVFISSIINIIANIIFIKYYGLYGAAIAFVISNFGWFLLTIFLNRKIKKQLLVSLKSSENINLNFS